VIRTPQTVLWLVPIELLLKPTYAPAGMVGGKLSVVATSIGHETVVLSTGNAEEVVARTVLSTVVGTTVPSIGRGSYAAV